MLDLCYDGCSFWEAAYLDLQKIVSANALVVHLVVGIVCIAATLILNKGEPAYVSTKLSCALRGYLMLLTGGSEHCGEQECHSGRDGHSCGADVSLTEPGARRGFGSKGKGKDIEDLVPRSHRYSAPFLCETKIFEGTDTRVLSTRPLDRRGWGWDDDDAWLAGQDRSSRVRG